MHSALREYRATRLFSRFSFRGWGFFFQTFLLRLGFFFTTFFFRTKIGFFVTANRFSIRTQRRVDAPRRTGPLSIGKADQTGTPKGVPDRYFVGACRNVSLG